MIPISNGTRPATAKLQLIGEFGYFWDFSDDSPCEEKEEEEEDQPCHGKARITAQLLPALEGKDDAHRGHGASAGSCQGHLP